MLVGGHALEVDVDSVVSRYVSASSHSPPARADLCPTARSLLHKDEKMAAFGGGGFRQRRHGDRRGAAGRRTVAAVAEVENGEVKSLAAADGDAQRRALGGTAGQASGVVRRLAVANQITAAE